MNREILFRGKPIDKKFGEWVEGFYMEDLDNGRVKSFIFNTCPIINGLFLCVNNSVHYLTVSDC